MPLAIGLALLVVTTIDVLVSTGVIVLRRSRPGLHRGFRVPLFPFVPLLSIAACLYLIVSLPWDTYVLVAVWITAALALYVGFSARHSVLDRADHTDDRL